LYEAVTGGGTNVYLNTFKMKSNRCTDEAFILYGAYNDYDLVANHVAANKRAVTMNDQSGRISVVADGPVRIQGQANLVVAAVETIWAAPSSIWEAAIAVNGANNTLLNPHVVMCRAVDVQSSIRVFGSGTQVINPIVFGTDFPAYAFNISSIDGPCTIVGGSMNCTFKMEVVAAGSDAAANDLAKVFFAGNTSSFYTRRNGVTVLGDEAATLKNTISEQTQVFNSPLTAARAVTLSTAGAVEGAKFMIVRTTAATGNYSLNVGTGPLRALNSPGQWCEVTYDGSAWFVSAAGNFDNESGVSNYGDENVTVIVGSSVKPFLRYFDPLTADRTVTLSTTGAPAGYTYRVTRAASATGAFNLNVGSGPLKALTPGTWCDVTYNADFGAWYLSGYGAL
jgi:hypothetical protein